MRLKCQTYLHQIHSHLMIFGKNELKCTFCKNELELCSVEHFKFLIIQKWLARTNAAFLDDQKSLTEQNSSSFLRNIHFKYTTHKIWKFYLWAKNLFNFVSLPWILHNQSYYNFKLRLGGKWWHWCLSCESQCAPGSLQCVNVKFITCFHDS